jgi:transposase
VSRTVAQVARNFDLIETALRKWVNQAEIDAGKWDGSTRDEREELALLRRENRRLQADVDLLKRATALCGSRGYAESGRHGGRRPSSGGVGALIGSA